MLANKNQGILNISDEGVYRIGKHDEAIWDA